MIERLKVILAEHRGESPVYIHLSEDKAIRLSDTYCVDASNGLVPDLRVLLGEQAILPTVQSGSAPPSAPGFNRQ